MVNYQLGKIYKLISNDDDRVYIGSTVESLCKRMSGHRRECKKYPNRNKSKWMVDCKDYRIVLIKLHPCNSFDELRAEEENVMKQFKDDDIELVNMCKAYRTIKEKKKYNNEYNNEYRENNKDKMKEYRENNKEKIKEKMKEYQNNNKEKKKEYYENNKEKIKAKVKEYDNNNKEKKNEYLKEYRFNKKIERWINE